jgi:hypothetical protein
MNEKNAGMITNERTKTLGELGNLLEKQIGLLSRGCFSGVEHLTEQTDKLVNEIAQTEILKLTEYKSWREYLRGLYQNLCLAIAAQKADIAEKKSQVRKIKKTIGAYRNSM